MADSGNGYWLLNGIATALVGITVMLAGNVGYAQLFPTLVNGSFSLGNASGPSPYNLSDTFFLESNPTASKTIYLDYRGYHSVGNGWGHDIQFNPFSLDTDVNNFSTTELIEIQRQFQNVAEDYLPFDVNVTTRDPGVNRLRRTSLADQEYGIRAVNTQPKNGFGNGIGGASFQYSFSSLNNDAPVFTFNKGTNNGAITNSHEVGHSLGLSHDGIGSQPYHPGVGEGPTGWGPIMGAPFGKNLTQWSRGDYSGATNTENDLAIITSNGFGFRADDYGNTLETAAALSHVLGVVNQWGIIERNSDVDFFKFTANAGLLSLQIDPFQGTPNLDIAASLYNSEGVLLLTSNPLDDVNARLNFTLAQPGNYFLSIDGVGKSGVYSDYGSLGFYYLQGSFVSAVPEPGTLALLLLFGLTSGPIRGRRRT